VPRDKKERVSTNATPELRTNPFAALVIQGRESASIDRDTRPGQPPDPAAKEKLLLRRSTAHRGGKTVLVLEGFSPAWPAAKLESLLHGLKTSLGCGGKIENRTLELQGDLADRLIPLLESREFSVKRGW
jgi:translation initiation factor 1